MMVIFIETSHNHTQTQTPYNETSALNFNNFYDE